MGTWSKEFSGSMTLLEGDQNTGYTLTVIAKGGVVVAGPNRVSRYVAERCLIEYRFGKLKTPANPQGQADWKTLMASNRAVDPRRC